jgi:hypothetical protein
MKKLITICLVCVLTAAASQGMVITLDENGHGNVDGTPLVYGVDNPPVGNWATLYYVLPFTTGVVTGDVAALEPQITSQISDVLRFINVQQEAGGGIEARVYVYSEMETRDIPPYDLADTGIPSLWTSGADHDPVYVNEVGPEGFNYVDYTPLGQTEITYHFISDIPEPATICMLGLGALSLIRRKRGA